jgi:F-box protein 9
MHEENVWVRVVHVVEFYRSLRFLPDGRTLSLLTTDAPSQTIRKMEPNLRGVKGFAIGKWTLHPQGLADDQLYSRPAGPKIIVDDLRDKTMSRYTFRIILKLDKTSRGKWNKMDILEYDSINLESGEVCALPLNHKKPFHFSTVRSYGI